MYSINQSTSTQPLLSDIAVLSSSACHSAQAGVESLTRNILDVIRISVQQEYLKQVAANAQPIVPREVLLTVEETSKLLKCTPQTVYNRARAGKLQRYKLGSSTYFKEHEVLAALEKETRPDGTRKNARRQFNPKGK
jgi:excisionase family DNA binding protein